MIDMMNHSMGPAVCRICMCGETSIPYLGKSAGEPLISPCHCKGTMGLYHRSCLEHWLSTSRTERCEICKFKFEVARKKRKFSAYVRTRGWRPHDSERSFLADLVCMLVIAPMASTAIYFCVRCIVEAGHKYANSFSVSDDENDISDSIRVRNEASLEIAAFAVVTFFLAFALVLWVGITLLCHCIKFKDWQKKNMIVYVVDQLDAEESMRYNPRLKTRVLGKLSRVWHSFRDERRSDGGTPEVRSSSQYPQIAMVEPVLGINPQLIAVFNQTSPDSENTHNHDSSRTALPFGRGYRHENEQRQQQRGGADRRHRESTMAPIALRELQNTSGDSNFYGEFGLPSRATSTGAGIGMGQCPDDLDLFTDVTLSPAPASASNGGHRAYGFYPSHEKSPSVSSVSSFHAGMRLGAGVVCSTPRHDVALRVVRCENLPRVVTRNDVERSPNDARMGSENFHAAMET